MPTEVSLDVLLGYVEGALWRIENAKDNWSEVHLNRPNDGKARAEAEAEYKAQKRQFGEFWEDVGIILKHTRRLIQGGATMNEKERELMVLMARTMASGGVGFPHERAKLFDLAREVEENAGRMDLRTKEEQGG